MSSACAFARDSLGGGAGPGLEEVEEGVAELLDAGGELPHAVGEALVGLERVRRAVERLAQAGAVSEIVERAPAEAASALRLGRVLLSRVEDGLLVAEALYCEEDDGPALLESLRAAPVQLAYPLLEAELLRRRRAQLLREPDLRAPVPSAFGELMRWRVYIAAPVVLGGRVIGFLHGDRGLSARPLAPLDRDVLARFGEGFALVFERAVLRQRLRIQRQKLRQVATWADARTSELSDATIHLSVEGEEGDTAESASEQATHERLRDLLTRRELDVLEYMVKGKTNAEIARALVVSAGTVKFHVKNILRKLNASNRAEATSRYMRLTMRASDASGAARPGGGRRL